MSEKIKQNPALTGWGCGGSGFNPDLANDPEYARELQTSPKPSDTGVERYPYKDRPTL